MALYDSTSSSSSSMIDPALLAKYNAVYDQDGVTIFEVVQS